MTYFLLIAFDMLIIVILYQMGSCLTNFVTPIDMFFKCCQYNTWWYVTIKIPIFDYTKKWYPFISFSYVTIKQVLKMSFHVIYILHWFYQSKQRSKLQSENSGNLLLCPSTKGERVVSPRNWACDDGREVHQFYPTT